VTQECIRITLFLLESGLATGLNEVRLASRAMATRWEIVLYGASESFLRSVAEEALDEVRRLEDQLSLFIPTSETSDLNRHAAAAPVVVDPRYFRLLQHALELSRLTNGAFDITVAPLMRAWRFEGGTGAIPTESAIREAIATVGYQHVLLDEDANSVQFDIPGLQIDLGAIGKGYAVECAIEIVRDHGVTSGILHAGTSTVFALGAPPDAIGWQVAVSLPGVETGNQDQVVFLLKDNALSVSAPHGKYFELEGIKYGHVVDPRSGRVITHHLVAAVATASACESDALSTALLTLGPDWIPELSKLRPDAAAVAAVLNLEGQLRIERLNLESELQRHGSKSGWRKDD
jgi:thiamine biosynthesis lipoprotein